MENQISQVVLCKGRSLNGGCGFAAPALIIVELFHETGIPDIVIPEMVV